jgi:hypothetical protein
MKGPGFRIWVIAALTAALGAAVCRLSFETTIAESAATLAIVIMLIVAALATYALFCYLLIKPSLKKLRRLPVALVTTVIALGGTAGCILHFIRFVNSPKASPPLGPIIAGLLLASAIILCGLLLWLVWRLNRGKNV